MERGRENRRGGGGAGAVSAPRRPRTIGFKDSSVGEDGDDIMDDSHNPRLRERPKKESSSSLHSVQAVPPSSVVPSSRSKRKRQGSQEVQDQARSSTVDDVDETTEDTEMDVSDDDDDPPPPPIPRRAVKFRPQGKFLEDGLSADLPAVPRKARTAILKRPQEASSVSLADTPLHQASAIPKAPAPPSSSVLSLKPGRRTKPINSKLRAAKVSKLSTQTVISEQEVEVAEALFDLARMVTSQPISASLDATVDAMQSSKPERGPNSEPEVKFEPKTLANFTVAPSFLPPQSSASSVPESITVLCVTTSQLSANLPPAVSVCSPAMSTASLAAATLTDSAITVTSPRPLPSPPPSMVVPPAEAPKRKRPRFKTRSDETGLASQVPPCVIGAVPHSSSVLSCSSSKQHSEQISNSVTHLAAESFVKMETTSRPSAAPTVVHATMTPPSVPTALALSTMFAPVLERRSQATDKRSISLEKVAKEEVINSSIPQEENQTFTADQMPASTPKSVKSPHRDLMRETGPPLHNSSEGMSLSSLELGKRVVQLPNSTSDEVMTNNVEIDSKACVDPVALGEDLLIDKGTEKEMHIDQGEQLWDRKVGKEPRPYFERDREREGERHKEESDGDNHRELTKDMNKNLERVEYVQSTPEQKFGKALMTDSRTPNPERAVVAGAISVASSVATLPLSVGMVSWPVGLPPVGYYSSGAAVATDVSWPGGGPAGALASVEQHMTSTVQLQHPYMIQSRHPQPWKRCASHVYIAHFIDAQQQMNRHPFIQAAYQNSASLFGSKSYNLNIPLTPAEALFGAGSGGPLISGTNAAGENIVAGGGSRPVSERNLNSSPAMTNPQAKDRVFLESVSRKQVVQQLQQPLQISASLSLQSRPGFGFPVSQVGTGGGPTAANGGGTSGDPESGSGSALVGLSSAPTSCPTTMSDLGTGAGNGGIVSHVTAQAQYLQAVMQQGAFPFPFQAAAHFGPGYSGSGPQQAPQYFSSPFYATHLVHGPTNAQQQLQKAANVSAGFLSNELQQPQKQVTRNFPPSSSHQQQQQQSIPPSASPSLSQQIQSHISTSQQMQRLVEREGNKNASESNSTMESKFPSLHRNVFTQGSCNVTASVSPPASMLLSGSASIHCLQPQDFNLIAGLGGKPGKQLQQSQLASQHVSPLQQQPYQLHHHVSSGTTVQMSLKGADQQSAHALAAMPVAAMSRVSAVGPGPLGLAPVAPVMAPQGHAMLQTIGDSARSHGQQQSQHHPSVLGSSHQLSIPPCQQQQRIGQMQRGVVIPAGAEDRQVVEGTAFPNRSGREVIDERKALPKRGPGSTLSRVDLDSSATIPGPPCGTHPTARISSNTGPALNLLTPTSAILITRSSGHSAGNNLQQTGPSLPLIQSSKQVPVRGKILPGSGVVNSVTSASSQLASFSDRAPLGSPLANKVSGPPLPLSGQTLAQGSHILRQGQLAQQHTQLKLSNRGSLGSLPTPSGAAPQAVLAAAIAKSQQGVQQQQSRPQTQASANTGPLPRVSSGNLGGLPISSSIPAKSVPPVSVKSNPSSKSSFPVSQRPSSAVSGKRSTPPNVPIVSPILGPTLVQTTSTKSQQQPSQNQTLGQQQQNSSTSTTQQSPQSVQQPPSLPPQTLTPTQQHYHHQQDHSNTQQHQMHNQQSSIQPQQTHHMQRQLFLQNPAFQPHQHQGVSQLSPHSQQQAGLRQQSQQSSHISTHQHGNPSSSQLPSQHHSSPQLHHQQQSMQQQQQPGLHSSAASFSVTNPTGSLSLSPLLTLGTGTNGQPNTSCWTPGPDGGGVSQSSGSRPNPATSNVSGSSVATPTGSNLQRSQCGAPSFLHPQFGAAVVSGQQQSNSPRTSSGPQYLQPVANPGGSGIAVDEIGRSGGVARKPETNNQPKL